MSPRRFCAVTFSTLSLFLAAEVEQLDGKRKGRKKTAGSVWAALGIDEDEWLRNSCFLFSSHFPSVKCFGGGLCVSDAIPLLPGQVLDTSPSSWCFYCETCGHKRFILATLETKAHNNDIQMCSFVLKEFMVTLRLIKKKVSLIDHNLLSH